MFDQVYLLFVSGGSSSLQSCMNLLKEFILCFARFRALVSSVPLTTLKSPPVSQALLHIVDRWIRSS